MCISEITNNFPIIVGKLNKKSKLFPQKLSLSFILENNSINLYKVVKFPLNFKFQYFELSNDEKYVYFKKNGQMKYIIGFDKLK